MLVRSISATEQQYIKTGCDQGIRLDGRGITVDFDIVFDLIYVIVGHDDYRPFTIENDIFPHVNASCRVKSKGGVDIIASVTVMTLCFIVVLSLILILSWMSSSQRLIVQTLDLLHLMLIFHQLVP
jgi:hypothetical protein